MNGNKPTLLLTGGSGVIGRALIDELSADFDIVCLRGRRPINDPRVRELVGDLPNPELGLRPDEYASLVSQVDVVVHGAAVTNWTVDPAVMRHVNVAGTAAMLRLAARAGAPLYYLSTAFVVRDVPSDERFAGLAAYMESKTTAEEMLRASDVDTVIVRPSVVSGDSRDGRMASFQGMHRMLGSIVRGALPVMPAEVDALVDSIPQDLVAEAIGALIRRGILEGEFWLTAGDQALSFSEYVDISEQVSELAGICATRPRFMPFESVDRLLLPLLDDLLSPEQRQTFVDFLESVWVFQSPSVLPSDLARLGFGDRVTKAALTEAAYRSLVYWAQVKGLLPAHAELEAVAS
ncbi:MAG: hypothetical protein QOE58_61 [Actinomycetota bacterium]|jgi:thioester reductase-like protein|nr:hypothetical protein [Actinomycetota bacterium]